MAAAVAVAAGGGACFIPTQSELQRTVAEETGAKPATS